MRALRITPDDVRSFVVYATKGLLDVAEDELKEIVPDALVRCRSDRWLIVRLTLAQVQAVGDRARAIDDIRLLVAGPSTVVDEKGLADFAHDAAVGVRNALEEPDSRAPWSVTVSARNPPWRRKPRWDQGPVLARELSGADVKSTQRQPVDVRLQVDGQEAVAAVNLWERPIGKQDRDISSAWPGALRPTVAAAMVRLGVDLGGIHTLYDPCCGSGTIVAEASHRGLSVYASDRSEEAVRLTRARLARAGHSHEELAEQIFVRNLLSASAPTVDAQLLVTNPPWGKQVRVADRTALFEALAEVIARTLGSGGAAVVLTTNEAQLISSLRSRGVDVTSRPIGLLGQTPALVTCN